MKVHERLWRSYHVKTAALAMVVAGLLLTGVSYYSYRGVLQLDRARLDMMLRETMLRLSVIPVMEERYWAEMDAALARELKDPRFPVAVLLVQDYWGNVVYQSEGWPAEVRVAEIPAPIELADDAPAGPAEDAVAPDAYPNLQPHVSRWSPPGWGIPPGPPVTILHLNRNARGREWRIAVSHGVDFSVAIGMDFDAARANSRNYERLLWVAVPLANLLVGLIVYVASYRAFRPVRVLAYTAGRITAQGLDERIAPGPWDVEFTELIEVFNAMLDRLSESFAVAGQFSADAAHELKTPLAVLQGELERGIQEAPAESPEQVRYSRLLDQVQRLKTITQKLLLLASVDSGNLKLYITAFDLSECIADACEDADILAPEITVTNNMPPGVVVMADADLLPQVVQNLVTNALLYNEAGGRVTINYLESPDRLKLRFSNTGSGIPQEDMGRVFDRFFRSDKSRSRARGGSGLGLSLAREIARAHGGDVVLEASRDGVTSFVLYLPRKSLVRQTV